MARINHLVAYTARRLLSSARLALSAAGRQPTDGAEYLVDTVGDLADELRQLRAYLRHRRRRRRR